MNMKSRKDVEKTRKPPTGVRFAKRINSLPDMTRPKCVTDRIWQEVGGK